MSEHVETLNTEQVVWEYVFQTLWSTPLQAVFPYDSKLGATQRDAVKDVLVKLREQYRLAGGR